MALLTPRFRCKEHGTIFNIVCHVHTHGHPSHSWWLKHRQCVLKLSLSLPAILPALHNKQSIYAPVEKKLFYIFSAFDFLCRAEHRPIAPLPSVIIYVRVAERARTTVPCSSTLDRFPIWLNACHFLPAALHMTSHHASSPLTHTYIRMCINNLIYTFGKPHTWPSCLMAVILRHTLGVIAPHTYLTE